MNTPVIFFCGVLAALLAAVLVFAGIYFTRIQTLNSIEKLTGYADGFNLYHMDVRYSYSLDDMMSYGVRDNQTMINVISKAALPFFPVKIQAPEFGCTAFTLTDRNGAVHMGRNYDFRNNTSAMLVCCTPENGYKSVAITSRIFRTFFWGSPGQVLLCLKSGHHGRLSRTHGPDVYLGFW